MAPAHDSAMMYFPPRYMYPNRAFRIDMPPTRYLAVGEVDGDGIGCYLFGIEATPFSAISYHSMAATHADLISDCMDFFEELAAGKERLVSTSASSARHLQDLKVVRNFIDNLPGFIGMHLASGLNEPFLMLGGMEIFLRTGMRQRQKVNGIYTE